MKFKVVKCLLTGLSLIVLNHLYLMYLKITIVAISVMFVQYLCSGEDKRIKEFYQSRGLERVIQPSGDGKSAIQCCL